jgi:predicted alpha/beta-fold hydrolase
MKETFEQRQVINWARAYSTRYPALRALVAIPNQHAVARWGAARVEGAQSGFPDMILPVVSPSGEYHALAIELKRVKGGVVSPEQQAWLDHLTEQGWLAVVCRGASETIATIEKYLDMEVTTIG